MRLYRRVPQSLSREVFERHRIAMRWATARLRYFHSMRVAEHGLSALLRKSGRSGYAKNKSCGMGVLGRTSSRALDAEIAVIGGKKPGAAKDAALEFYSGARADLNGFKDEYRNLVSARSGRRMTSFRRSAR